MSLSIRNMLSEETEVLSEDFEDTIDSWLATAERKMTGYSVKEIDILANKAKNVDSEVKKREALEHIDDAVKDARTTMTDSKTDEKKRKGLRLQLQVLGELRSKVNSFKVVEDHDDHKKEPAHNKIDLDAY